jgi:formylmethanofuran dehydrogenase subunit A
MREEKRLSEHEMNVRELLVMELAGLLRGFPDTAGKLDAVARAWAAFMSLEPYHVEFPKQVEQYMSEEEKAPYMWKEGVVPGEWLVAQVRDKCEWMPAPVVARRMYCAGGFKPADGQMPAVESVRRADTEEE